MDAVVSLRNSQFSRNIELCIKGHLSLSQKVTRLLCYKELFAPSRAKHILTKMKIFFIVASAILFSSSAHACSCTMPSSCLPSYKTESTPMFKATAMKTVPVPDSAYSWTVFKYETTFRGCAPSTKKIIVKSPKTAESCGVSFTPGMCYLLTVRKSGSMTPPPMIASKGMPVYSAVSCAVNKPWELVPYKTKSILYKTPVFGC